MDDPICNTASAARYLNCSASFLNKLRCNGGGPEFIKNGTSVAYRRSALDAYAKKRTFKSTTEADALIGKRQRKQGELPSIPDSDPHDPGSAG